MAGWAVSGRRSEAALTVVDCTPLAKVLVKGPVDGAITQVLDVPYGRAARRTWPRGREGPERLLIGAAPGEWLALAPPGAGPALVACLKRELAEFSADSAAVLDYTHARALVRLVGERSVAVLAKECSLDLGDDVFPDGAALSGVVAGLATGLVRDDQDTSRSYLLHCEWSAGQYLWDSLVDAGGEFGVDVEGFALPGL